MTPPQVRIDSSVVVRAFGTAIVAFGLLHLAGQGMRHGAGFGSVYGLIDQFDLANEGNLPSFFSSLQLLICGLVLALIGRVRLSQRDRHAAYWLALAALLFCMGADEAAGLHELLIRPVREALPGLATGLLYWAWVIPGSVAVLVIAAVFARFARDALPPSIRRQVILSALLFFGGAIGVEMPEAAYVERVGQDNFGYALYVLVEEMLEMVGALVLLSAILCYWRTMLGPVVLEPQKRGTGRAGPPQR
jgi:hypothetical protein